MPHITIEYSANLDQLAPTSVDALLDGLHQAALDTGAAPLAGLRTRAVARTSYRIADRHPDNVFVAITARLGAGRDAATRRMILEALTEAAQTVLDPLELRSALSVEFQEMQLENRINDNKIRAYLETEAEAEAEAALPDLAETSDPKGSDPKGSDPKGNNV